MMRLKSVLYLIQRIKKSDKHQGDEVLEVTRRIKSILKNPWIVSIVTGLVTGTIGVFIGIYVTDSTDIQSAQTTYLAGDYKEAFQRYSNTFLKDNAIALNNLGCLYSQGKGTQKNTNLALEYYLKSYKLGERRGISNYIALKIKESKDFKTVIKQLRIGVEKYDDRNTKLLILSCIERKEGHIAENQIKAYVENRSDAELNQSTDYFFCCNEQKQIDILLSGLSSWRSDGRVTTCETIRDELYKRATKVSSSFSAGCYRGTYSIWVRTFKDNRYLQEEIIKI